jgi:nitrite reductase (cytochrome c-552)
MGFLRNRSTLLYVVSMAVVAGGTIGVMWLLGNIAQRKEEARQDAFRVVELNEDTVDPAIWGKNYPQQYDSYLLTAEEGKTKHGGSEAFQRLDEFPSWREIYKGYAFSVDFREDRGHAYMLYGSAPDRARAGRQAVRQLPPLPRLDPAGLP